MIGRAHPLLFHDSVCSERAVTGVPARRAGARPTVAGQRRTRTGFPHHGRNWVVIIGSIVAPTSRHPNAVHLVTPVTWLRHFLRFQGVATAGKRRSRR